MQNWKFIMKTTITIEDDLEMEGCMQYVYVMLNV